MIRENDMLLLLKQTASWLTSPKSLPISLWCGDEKIIGIPESFLPTQKIVANDGKTDYIFTGTDPVTRNFGQLHPRM